MRHSEAIENDLTLDYSYDGRLQDDAKIAPLTDAIQMRSHLLRAFDHDERRVPVALARSYAADAISHVRCDLKDLVDGESAASRVADLAAIFRDLVAWVIDHELADESRTA